MRKSVQAHLDDPERQAFDDWRRRQPVIPSEADALRELLKRGLEASEKAARK
jgi:hypothetical protein